MTAALLCRARALLGDLPDDELIELLLGVGVAAIDLTLAGRLAEAVEGLETLVAIAIRDSGRGVRR